MPILLSLLAGLFILTACEEETAAPKKDRPPIITAIEDQTVQAGSSLTVRITATDDPDQIPTLSYSPILPYASLTSTGEGTADLLFEPGRNVSPGETNITITASSADLTDTETFTLTITDPEDRPPNINSISPNQVSVAIGKITNVTVIASDPDPDDTPSFSLLNNNLDFINLVDLRNGTATINITPLDPKTSMHVGQHIITVKASSGGLSAETNFTLTITESDSDGDGTVDSLDVDDDNDGLIEINSLDELHNIRYNLAGSSYKTSAADPGNTRGAPGSSLKGYELTRDLDFNDPTSYESNEINSAWTRGEGWLPIGGNSTRFTGILEGNGYTITNLMIRRDTKRVGLFGYIGTTGQVRNLGIENGVADYTGNSGENNYIGLLAGQSDGTIIAVHTSGIADGGNGNSDRVGGLVGVNSPGSTITACHATGNANGGSGNEDSVGGLVGFNEGTITACHATGMADGENGKSDYVGGLVGFNNGGTITACHATGMADGGNGNTDRVGGLVGWNWNGRITACHATGNANGGSGNEDSVGGLVGWNNGGTITACYATGMADGGNDPSDSVGGLVGQNTGGTITACYGFGMVTGRETPGVDRSGDASATVGSASALTMTNSSTDQAKRWSTRVWDFGDSSQNPVLKWITGYNSSGSTDEAKYPCDVTLLPAGRECGDIIPGQER